MAGVVQFYFECTSLLEIARGLLNSIVVVTGLGLAKLFTLSQIIVWRCLSVTSPVMLYGASTVTPSDSVTPAPNDDGACAEVR